MFGATGDVPAGRPAGIRIGDSLVVVGATVGREPFPAFPDADVNDVDRVFSRALEAGASVLEDPVATPYGGRRAMIRDPFGNIFQIARRLPSDSV